MMVSKELLASVSNRGIDLGKLADSLNKYMPEYDITSENEVTMFLAQISHESAGFSRLSENLNYSAQGLANTWPTRFAKRDERGRYLRDPKTKRRIPNEKALHLHRNPERIANSVYSDRMGNGSEQSGEGWKYRGRGFKQLTGKYNYELFKKETGVDIVKNPDLLLQLDYAVLSACWFWKRNKLSVSANAGNIVTNTKIINGGNIGLSDRRNRWNRLKAAIAKPAK